MIIQAFITGIWADLHTFTSEQEELYATCTICCGVLAGQAVWGAGLGNARHIGVVDGSVVKAISFEEHVPDVANETQCLILAVVAEPVEL